VQVSFTVIPGDPVRLGEAIRFLLEDARPDVESEPGSQGITVGENADLGVAVVKVYWASAAELCAAEKVAAPIRQEAALRAGGTASVEVFEVAALSRAVRPHPGAGIRLTRLATEPARLDAAITTYADLTVPWLAETEGFCATLLYVDRSSGQTVVESIWRDANALAASRSAAAAIRVAAVAATGGAVRAVEEYRLVASSLRY
jgi:quinol monooxygenase YgiN